VPGICERFSTCHRLRRQGAVFEPQRRAASFSGSATTEQRWSKRYGSCRNKSGFEEAGCSQDNQRSRFSVQKIIPRRRGMQHTRGRPTHRVDISRASANFAFLRASAMPVRGGSRHGYGYDAAPSPGINPSQLRHDDCLSPGPGEADHGPSTGESSMIHDKAGMRDECAVSRPGTSGGNPGSGC